MTYKKYDFSTQAGMSFEAQKSNFLRNNIRDVQYEFKTEYDIPGARDNVLLYN